LKKGLLIYLGFFIVFGCCHAAGAFAVTLIIPSLEARSGGYIEVPVLVDRVDNLAGIKLTLRYDDEVLQYEDARPSEWTDALMHVTNRKTPGCLIVVMAGAEGVKGRNMPLIYIGFRVKNGLKEKQSLAIRISNIQLVSDQLKNLKSDTGIHPLTILPESDKSCEDQQKN